MAHYFPSYDVLIMVITKIMAIKSFSMSINFHETLFMPLKLLKLLTNIVMAIQGDRNPNNMYNLSERAL